MAALSAQTTQASRPVPGGSLVGLSGGIAVGRTSCDAAALALENARLEAERRATADALRRIARGIYPSLLATFGLAEALTAEARLSGVAVQVLTSRVGSSTPEVDGAVHLCCLEAIQNAARHAGRDARVIVRLNRDEDELTFSVEDDGCGFEPAWAEGSGLAGMEDRIVPLGGRLEVSSALGHGTTVADAVPWRPRTENTALATPAQAAVA